MSCYHNVCGFTAPWQATGVFTDTASQRREGVTFSVSKLCERTDTVQHSVHTPLDLSVLTTESKHSPDGREHLFCDSSCFGVCRLLFTGEARQHLIRREGNNDIASAGRSLYSDDRRGNMWIERERQKDRETDTLNLYLAEKCGGNAQCRAHSQDDKSELPAFGEANDEGRQEGGVGLDQHPRLVTDTLLDLVDITKACKHKPLMIFRVPQHFMKTFLLISRLKTRWFQLPT